jgi:hypothetical protein
VILNVLVGNEKHPDLKLEKLFPETHHDGLEWDEICRHKFQLSIFLVLIYRKFMNKGS